MQAVILAAWKGTRLKPFTDKIPKPLLKVKNRVIILQTLSKLPDEIDEIIIVIWYLWNIIKEYLWDEYNWKKIIYVEQNKLLWSGHALKLCKKFLNDRFLVLMGDDIYSKKDLKECLNYSRCMLVYEQKKPFTGNDILVKDNIFVWLKKIVNQKNVLVNTAAYVLDMIFFDFKLIKIENSPEFSIPHTLASITEKYPVKIIKTKKWKQINTISDLNAANH